MIFIKLRQEGGQYGKENTICSSCLKTLLVCKELKILSISKRLEWKNRVRFCRHYKEN
ncbi:hypothetical protein [Helicobacter felistomachi]|uniref:hypothetical protein n=1 Tax=Helicobacter felistomachi TaxID=3040201 RepID=UPI002573FDC1|nr:hypothetical protein [Helicobacter sp. NHP21005]